MRVLGSWIYIVINYGGGVELRGCRGRESEEGGFYLEGGRSFVGFLGIRVFSGSIFVC